MPFPLKLNQEEYEALVAFARKGTLLADGSVDADLAHGLDAWLRMIEEKNDVDRYFVWVQWQDQDAPLPAGTNFPTKWPPSLRAPLSLISRPISRTDVDSLLAAKARKPTNVLVTRDPAGLVGWTELDVFFK